MKATLKRTYVKLVPTFAVAAVSILAVADAALRSRGRYI